MDGHEILEGVLNLLHLDRLVENDEPVAGWQALAKIALLDRRARRGRRADGRPRGPVRAYRERRRTNLRPGRRYRRSRHRRGLHENARRQPRRRRRGRPCSPWPRGFCGKRPGFRPGFRRTRCSWKARAWGQPWRAWRCCSAGFSSSCRRKIESMNSVVFLGFLLAGPAGLGGLVVGFESSRAR